MRLPARVLIGLLALAPAAGVAGDFGFDLDEGRLDLMSHYVWRGYERSDDLSVRSTLHAGVWGRAITGDGRNGASLQFEYQAPLRGRDPARAYDQFAGSLVITRQLSDAVEVGEPCLRAGYTQYLLPHGSDGGTDEHSEEFFAEARGLVRFGSQQDWTLKPYVRASYAFGRYKGFYGTLGVAHRIDPQKFPVIVDLDSAISFSNYDDSGDTRLDFHDWTSSLGVFYEKGALRIGPAVAISVSSREVSSTNSVWVELRVGFLR
jgi:hypothetical protein